MLNFDLRSNFIVIDSELCCTPVAVGPMLYQDLDRDFSNFKQCCLFAEYTFDQDWPTWEMHPAGDEILYLIVGSVDLVLLENNCEHIVHLNEPGKSTIVPRGIWHTTRVIEKAKILFMTPGEGTVNAVDPRNPHALA
jgi:mannose-6-phosphate isomerase-like protein (cupin superfamily)